MRFFEHTLFGNFFRFLEKATFSYWKNANTEILFRGRECVGFYNAFASRSTKCCILQQILVSQKNKSFLPICLFFSLCADFTFPIGETMTRSGVGFWLSFAVCGFPIRNVKFAQSAKNRHIGRNELLFCDTRICCKMQHFVDRAARKYRKNQYILDFETKFRCCRLSNTKMWLFPKIEKGFQKACVQRSASYWKTIDLTKLRYMQK